MRHAERTQKAGPQDIGNGQERLSVRQLEAFRAFMLARTTNGAAAILGISQPAISRLIEQLEHSLRFELFDRKNGRLIPTPEADIFFEEVERTFVSVDKITEIARDIQSARMGSLTVAAMPALAHGFLPTVVARFAKHHPRARISLLVCPSAKIEELVSAHHVDFGLGEFPFVRSSVNAAEFCRAPYVLGMPSGHRLAALREVSASDLAGVPFISLSNNTAARHTIDQQFLMANVIREQYYDAQNSGVVAGLIAQGLGVGLIDPFTAHDFHGRGIEIRPFEPQISFRVGVLHPAHRPLSRVGREFLGMLQTVRKEWGIK